MIDVAAELRRIRSALPVRLTVRAMSAVFGSESPNGYGYYESRQFKRTTLPLEKARPIAEIFAKHGGDPNEVLRLTGMSEAEIAAAENPAVTLATGQTIRLDVALPSADRLTAMMDGLLRVVGLPEIADGYAERLALHLPNALARAAGDFSDSRRLEARGTSEGAPPPLADHPELRQ